MEFRIAPLILSVLLTLYLLFVNPNIHTNIQLSFAANYSRAALPIALLLVLSLGTFFRHKFYASTFRWAFWILFLVNLLLIVYYFYVIEQQHMH